MEFVLLWLFLVWWLASLLFVLYLWLYILGYFVIACIPYFIASLRWSKYSTLLFKLWILWSWSVVVWFVLIYLAFTTETWKFDRKANALTFQNIWDMFKSL